MQASQGVRTVLAVRELQEKPVPPDRCPPHRRLEPRAGEAACLSPSAANRRP